MEPAVVILNYHSGTGLAREYRDAIMTLLKVHFSSVDVHVIAKSDDAERYAYEARKNGVSHVFVAGGDGTVSDVIQGLLHSELSGKPTPTLGIFPAGTGNGFVRTLGLPSSLPKAIAHMTFEKSTCIDIGYVNGIPFIHAVTIGSLPEGIRNVTAEEKSRLGFLAYVSSEIKRIGNDDKIKLHITCDDIEFSSVLNSLIVFSANSAANQVLSGKKSELDDGLLHLLFLKDASLGTLLKLMPAVLIQNLESNDQVCYLKGKHIRIESLGDALDSGIDGDDGPCLPLDMHIEPHELLVYC